jgi:hypothetical protein
MNALWGALIGGAISLATTLAVDVVRARREMRHRWDTNGLAAIEQFVEIANRTIGALYDEGRARAAHGDDHPTVAEADRTARSLVDSFRVAHARARLLMPGLAPELLDYDTALRALRRYADEGFTVTDSRWRELQAELSASLERLMSAATRELDLRSS